MIACSASSAARTRSSDPDASVASRASRPARPGPPWRPGGRPGRPARGTDRAPRRPRTRWPAGPAGQRVRGRLCARSVPRAGRPGRPPGRQGGPGRAGLLARLATLASGSDDLVRAAELAEQAIIEARDDPQARAQALEVAAVLDMNLDRPRRAAHRAEAALALYRRSGDAQGRARILDGRAMATFLDGDITAGVLLFQQVANLFEDCGDLVRLVTPRSTRGHALVFNGQPVAGLVDATGALETARTLGHPEGQAYALWHRSEALSALDRADEASHDAREAIAIANRLGHRGWTATGWRAVGIAEQARCPSRLA